MIWSAVTASYFKVIREISTGIKFITEMDSALTEIGMVTNQTREQTAGLAKEYNNLAKEMKVLTSDLTSSAVEFYRQGLSQEEVMERMRVSTMYSKIANLEFATSAEVLTATVNSMGIDIEKAADVFLYMGDATATSGAEIGKGFQKVGGTASALGIEFEKVASWIAIISSKTRESAESIGTSINTMLSRLSRITQTGFNEDDDTKLNDVAKALDTVGIALTDQTGNFRDFGVIIDEIAVKWDTLDDKTQLYIANTIGGVRQQSRFFNLMDGYAESMELYEESLEAAGTAQEKFNLYLESNQATIDRARTAIESLWLTMLDSDSLMNVVKVFTSFIETLDSLVGKFGVIGTALNFIVPLIGVKLAWSIRSSYIEMLKLNAANANFTSLPLAHVIGGIVKQLFGMEVAAKGATIATGGLTLATAGLTAGLVLLPILITAIVNAEDRRKKAMEESLALFEKQNEASKSIGELVKSYEELGDKAELTAEENQKLLDVKTKIKDLLPKSKNAIDNENLSLKEQIEIIEDLNEQELERARRTASETIDKYGKDVDFYKNAIEQRAKSIENMTNKLSELQLKQARGQELTKEESKELTNLIQWIELYNGHQENAINIVNAVESAQELLNKGLKENAERYKWARAEEIASQDIREMSISQAQGLQDELKSLGFTSDEVAQIMKGNLTEVKDKYDVLDDAMLESLVTTQDLDEASRIASINRLNQSRELTIGFIEDTKARIKAMREENALLANDEHPLLTKKKKESDPLGGIIDESIMRYNEEKLEEYEGLLDKIDKALENLNRLGANSAKISGTKKPKKGAKKKEEYKAEADRYARINLELERNNVLLKLNKTYQDQAGNDLAKKIKLMEEEIELNKERQGLLHDYNTKMREEAKSLQKDLSGIFNFEGSWDDNSMTITNMDAIAGKSEKVKEKYDRILEIIKDLPKASQEWATKQLENLKIGENIADLQKQEVSARFANSKDWIEKRNFYDDWGADNEIAAWERVREYITDDYKKGDIDHKEYTDYMLEIDKNLANEQQRIADESAERVNKQQEFALYLVNQEIAALEKKKRTIEESAEKRIKAIETTIKLLQERLEIVKEEQGELQKLQDRAAYIVNQEINSIEIQKNEIKGLYDAKISAIQDEIDRLEERNDLLEEEENRQKKLLDMADQKKRLENTLKERNVRILQDGEWTWVADPKKVADETEKLKDLQEGYGKWEEDLAKQKEIKGLRDQIKILQEQQALEEAHYDNQIFNLQEFIKEHTRVTHEFYGEEVRGLEGLMNSIKSMESGTHAERMDKLKPFLNQYLNITKQSRLDQLNEEERLTNDKIKEHNKRIEKIREETSVITEQLNKQVENLNLFISEYNDRTSEFYGQQITGMSTLLNQIKNAEAGNYGDRLTQLGTFVDDYLRLASKANVNIGSASSGSSSEKSLEERNREIMDYNERLAAKQGVVLKNNSPQTYTRMKTPSGGWASVNDNYIDQYLRKGYSLKHKGGVVGDGSRDLPEVVNKLFNTKPDEQMVKALKGELFIPEENIFKNFLPNMQSLLNMSIPKMPKAVVAGVGGGGIKQQVTVKEIVFPNVRDAKQIEGAINNLSTYANQWANQK